MASKTLNKVGKWLILIALLTYTVIITVWAGQRDATRRCSGIEVRIEQHSFMGDTMTQRGVITELAAYDKHLEGKVLKDIVYSFAALRFSTQREMLILIICVRQRRR